MTAIWNVSADISKSGVLFELWPQDESLKACLIEEARQGTKSRELLCPRGEYGGMSKRPARQKRGKTWLFLHKTDIEQVKTWTIGKFRAILGKQKFVRS